MRNKHTLQNANSIFENITYVISARNSICLSQINVDLCHLYRSERPHLILSSCPVDYPRGLPVSYTPVSPQ